MSSGIASLHKILKDESRRNIILLLNEKGSLSYTELLDASDTGSTGLLNYHLKVLDDLLSKNGNGKYILTDKGKLASKLLLEFSEESNQLQKRKQKRYWTLSAVIQIVYLVSVLTLYYFGLVDFGRLVLYSIMFVGSIGLCYLAYKVQGKKQPIPGSKEDKERYKRAYVLIGGVTGLFLSFFGTVFLTFISIRLGGPNFIRMINGPWEFFLLATVLIVSGSAIGYYLGKRNNFGKPKWMDKIDEKFGF